MNLNALLVALIERAGSNNGEPVFITTEELEEWPGSFLCAIKTAGLIKQAPPATSAVCPGCEEMCSMPVNTLLKGAGSATAFVICDKRDDINRVAISLTVLEQWQASAYSMAHLLSELLKLSSPPTSTNSKRWELGVLRGKKHSSHLILVSENKLILSVAGHELALNELLFLRNNQIAIDKLKITRAIDSPATGSGDIESAKDRQIRLQKRVDHFKSKGHRNFIKLVAEEEGITTVRLHQILKRK